MGFITKCFIRKNTPELQEKLKEMGYDICPCVDFETSKWLDNNIETNSIHGVPEHSIGIMLHEADAIDCGENDKLFLALAAMRDDTNEEQLFLNELGDWAMYHTDPDDDESTSNFEFYRIPYSFDIGMLRKATVEEIIKRYSNE